MGGRASVKQPDVEAGGPGLVGDGRGVLGAEAAGPVVAELEARVPPTRH